MPWNYKDYETEIDGLPTYPFKETFKGLQDFVNGLEERIEALETDEDIPGIGIVGIRVGNEDIRISRNALEEVEKVGELNYELGGLSGGKVKIKITKGADDED